MKKCKKCGTVQSGARTVCLECGSVLGKAMSAEEKEAAEAVLYDKLDNMAERTDDFYIPVRDKIISALCVLGVIAAVILIVFANSERNEIKASIPDNVIVTVGDGFTSVLSDGTGDYVYPSRRMGELDNICIAALVGIFSLVVTLPTLLLPRFMWLIGTLRYRLFYGWDTTPSYFALFIRKAAAYILFAVGVAAVICGWYWWLK